MSTLISKHSLIGSLICLSILIVIIGLNVILEWAVVENFNINNVEVEVPILSILSMFVFGLIKQVEERYSHTKCWIA